MDYKKAYYKLFNLVSDAVELLKKAQKDVEEDYIDSNNSQIVPQPMLYDTKKSKYTKLDD